MNKLMPFRQLNEVIEGMPKTMDPYAASGRPDVRMSSETTPPAEKDEIPDAGEPSGTDQPIKPADEQIDIPPVGDESAGAAGGIGPGPAPAPPEVMWEKFKLPDKRDLGYRRTDGFFLRFRKTAVQGKYLAQLWRGDKVLSKGFTIVPVGEDPIAYIQGIADAMLDAGSERKKQEEPEEPEEPLGPTEAPEGGEPVAGAEGTPEEAPGELTGKAGGAPEVSEEPTKPEEEKEEEEEREPKKPEEELEELDLSDLDLG
jgi:hypothetical protein